MDYRWGDIHIEPPEAQVLTLWSVMNGCAITSHQNLTREMARLNFKPLEVSLPSNDGSLPSNEFWGLDSEEEYGVHWKAYRYISDTVPRTASMDLTPRLPYPVIEGAHPLVYIRFLEDVYRWVPDHALMATIFSLRIVPLKDDVKASAKISSIYGDYDGMMSCSWLKEQGVIVYRLNTLDHLTLLRGFELNPENEEDCIKSVSSKLDANIAKDAAINPVFKKGWNFVKVLGLWDVAYSSTIQTHEELKLLMHRAGFQQTQIIYPNADIDDFKTKKISYSFANVNEAEWPCLPYPDLEACHPLIYLKFLKAVAACVGNPRTSRMLDIRGKPLTPSVLERHAYDGLLPTTWKGQYRYKYSSSSLDEAVRIDNYVADLEDFVAAFQHLEGDITEYKNDLNEYFDSVISQQIHAELVASGGYEG